MGTIHILSEVVANKIAAGEVIERPASIVKELIENSLDAGATDIEIRIKHGGRSFIRVADNGSGMNAVDAELALKRHATSKIEALEDLNRIDSFGFRGEALASIAAVSRLHLITRPQGVAEGVEIAVEGGKLLSASSRSCREGTIFEIRDLFFNTPARRKFLRTDNTESGHVIDIVSNVALANPKVRFALYSANKLILDFLPVSTSSERARSVFGREHAQNFLEIDGKGEGIRVRGVISKPKWTRANRSGQIFFVNKRWIRSPGLGYAVQDGYHGLLMHGNYAVCVLFLEIDPDRVDVNVHPTKQEVRFSRESEIKSLIRRTVTECLQKEGDIAPDLRLAHALTSTASGVREFQPSMKYEEARHVRESGLLKVTEPHAGEFIPREAALDEPILIRDLCITKILGQIHHTFIVAETEEGMIIVDQHAAHEKVMFETLLKEFQNAQVERQGLLMEEIFEARPKQKEILDHARPFLKKAGFEIDAFGENSYVIRSFPALLGDENPKAVVTRYLEQVEEGKLRTDLENVQEEIAALFACKRRSVKAHDALTAEGMKSLVQRLAQCENPFHCPHGRPTFFKQPFSDLEKQFKRK